MGIGLNPTAVVSGNIVDQANDNKLIATA